MQITYIEEYEQKIQAIQGHLAEKMAELENETQKLDKQTKENQQLEMERKKLVEAGEEAKKQRK